MYIKSFPNAPVTQGATSGLECRVLWSPHRTKEPIRHRADDGSATDLDSFERLARQLAVARKARPMSVAMIRKMIAHTLRHCADSVRRRVKCVLAIS
jgi:hypothetical protein